MGLQTFSYALHDQPDLVEAICQRVGELVTAVAAHVVTIDNVGMLFLGDDMGFHSGTLISPADLRRYFLPHHKMMAEVGPPRRQAVPAPLLRQPLQAHGRPHRRRAHRRQALLRGHDPAGRGGLPPLGRPHRHPGRHGHGLPGPRRQRSRCAPAPARSWRSAASGGGYCLGTGNSVANYIPLDNYLAMLDEGRRWNREHFGVA